MNDLMKISGGKLIAASFNKGFVKVLFELFVTASGGWASPLKTAIEEGFRIWSEAKMYCFFEALDKGNVEINEDLISNSDFLHSYFATIHAVNRSRTKERIEMFVRALGRYSRTDVTANADRYDEFIRIMLDLSDTEIIILSTIDCCESQVTGYSEMEIGVKYERAKSFHDAFEHELATKVPLEQINSRIIRLERTGLIEKFRNYILDGGGADPAKNVIPRCFLTPFYYEFRDYFVK